MGIKGLTPLIRRAASAAITHRTVKDYSGRRIAVDASMALYQLMCAKVSYGSSDINPITGKDVSHLTGLWGRALWMLEFGIIPLFVFDGKPPLLKEETLIVRAERKRQGIERYHEECKAKGISAARTLAHYCVSLRRDHTNECKALLRAMGIPYMQALSEAEAQCASLVRNGLAFAAATEDMDVLAFGCPVVLRHFNLSHRTLKNPVLEFNLQDTLRCLHFTMDQFVDLCILFGCDYCRKIGNMGPTSAFALVQKHGSIESILRHIDRSKYEVPNKFGFDAARSLFSNPATTRPTAKSLQLRKPDVRRLHDILIHQSGVDADRVNRGLSRLRAAHRRMAYN